MNIIFKNVLFFYLLLNIFALFSIYLKKNDTRSINFLKKEKIGFFFPFLHFFIIFFF